MSLTPEESANLRINEAVSWDDRKTLADVYQRNGGKVQDLSEETYMALILLAKWGAQRVIENET